MAEDTPKFTTVTSFDVARRAGVSRSAVSRAFTPGTSISRDTREKVLKAAADMGYRVNLVARGLNKQRTDLVGMIAAGMSNPFRSEQIDALAKQLVRQGFRPMLFCIDQDMDEEQLLSILLNYQVSGVVITSDAPPREICEECARMQVPLVLVGRGDALPFVDLVNGDDAKGGRMAADRLMAAGHERLVVLAPIKPVHSVSARIAAFVQHAARAGVKTEEISLISHDYESGRDAAGQLAARRDQRLGVFCPTDVCALGLLDSLRVHHGVDVPGQMRLIGYDDIPQAGWVSANLTTVKQSVSEFARVTVDLLKERIKNPEAEPKSAVIDVELVPRGTA
jgi:DNA-binding LacI/PurR family transcriptional regulator